MEIFHKYVENILNNYRFQGKNINLTSEKIINGFSIKNNIITFIVNLDAQDENFIKTLTEDLLVRFRNEKNVSEVKFVFTNEKQQHTNITGIKKIILISSAKGGVGKSTITSALAQYLQKQGLKIGILDADIYGPSLPTLTNIFTKPEIDNGVWIPHKWHNILINSIGYLVDEKTSLIWRGPMISKSIYQLMLNTKWEQLDYLLIDMPPGTGDIHLSISKNFQIAGCFIVSTPHNLSTSDTSRTISMYNNLSIPILGIIKNMAFIKQGLTKQYLFGKGEKLNELIKEHNLTLTTEIPFLEHNTIDSSYFDGFLSFLPK